MSEYLAVNMTSLGWKLPGEMVTYGLSWVHVVVEFGKVSEIPSRVRECV